MVKLHYKQIKLLDVMKPLDFDKITSNKAYNTDPVILTTDVKTRLSDYSLEEYIKDVEQQGLQTVWDNICQYVTDNCQDLPELLAVDNFGELYEIGLALQDKQLKKNSGQYYTPNDVTTLMCKWLLECKDGKNVCDVACGTGKLILTYLDLIGYDKARELIYDGRLYLYDSDNVALKICRTILGVKYGLDIVDKINDICCDFLDRSISLPDDSRVISNPPYAQIVDIPNYWEHTDTTLDTKEYYAIFMEKILKQSLSSVIISPYSFISGNKFYSLRRELNNYSGFIVSFDNVPGNIFCGRKHGIFNTNTSNSVRAAITVTEKNKPQKGYRLSPLIRFKQTERKKLLKPDVLEEFLNPDYQIVDESNTMFYKCDKRLAKIFKTWVKKSSSRVLLEYVRLAGEYSISMPNTCRYYTTASESIMNRSGQMILRFDDKKVFNYVFCLINSSFAYWYWRIYDGGITYPKRLLLNMPVFYELLTESDFQFFEDIASEMIKKSKDYIITKNNVGTQENIKYPREYRDKLNERFFRILDIHEDCKIFDIVHSNMALEVNI
ncbi:N-6 DNA methylase [bacterium]|nr:N-6 DNA methylase [bacterium]